MDSCTHVVLACMRCHFTICFSISVGDGSRHSYAAPAFEIIPRLRRFRVGRIGVWSFSQLAGGSAGVGGPGRAAVAYDRMLDYWLRMAAGAFALVGCWYLILMIWPAKYHAAIPWFGGLMLAEGVILLVHGLRLSLPPFPFYGDTAACFVGGGGIVYFSRYAKPEERKDA